MTSRRGIYKNGLYLLKKDLCQFYHISNYTEWLHRPGRFLCVENSRKVEYNPCPRCAYIWQEAGVCCTYVCACMSVSVCLCVSVCVHSKAEAPAACYSREHSPQGESVLTGKDLEKLHRQACICAGP